MVVVIEFQKNYHAINLLSLLLNLQILKLYRDSYSAKLLRIEITSTNHLF
jgi:hypothetical protein